jgi:hypothetical protein
VLCTEYDVGVRIGWHRVKRHFDRILGLSLGAACKFRFRRSASTKFERFTLEAMPRSIYGISGEARSVWEHSIPEVEAKRYAITFRTMADAAPLGRHGPVGNPRPCCWFIVNLLGRFLMADDLKNRGPADRDRVNENEPHEVRYWTEKFGCTKEDLELAVKQVGVMADKVESYLRGRT